VADPRLLAVAGSRETVPAQWGRFMLTGSQQFGLMDGITQSLAGRVGMLTLLPLSNAELASGSRQAGAAARERSGR
jgi:hypothetical protein